MQLKPLTHSHTDAARTLLEANGLPTDDLDDASIHLVGAFDADTLLGVVGLQRCGTLGLLRSLAVSLQARDRGVGRALCEQVVELASSERLEALWLLTTSAAGYFERHAFVVAHRDTTPPSIKATAQFSSLCPSTAIVMRRALTTRAT